jgi:precorrin-8X/cobalt-precorrin-8 methylmutase
VNEQANPTGPAGRHDYLRDGDEIYRRSFHTIRSETDLSGIPADLRPVAVRMIHACGMVDLVDDLAFSDDVGAVARRALVGGAPILTDAMMVAHGVTRARLPADNEVLCLLGDPEVAPAARRDGTTRSAAAVDRWMPRLGGAVVAIGNAPTALFRLLELLEEGAPRPAAILGLPVGFVGAAESKLALAVAQGAHPVPWLTVHGRRSGSAMAAAAVNALASESE